MGRQIQIAQASEDEKEACAFLQAKEAWLALPLTFLTSTPEPVPLGRLRAGAQLIFPAAYGAFLRGRIIKREPASWRGETASAVKDYLVAPSARACIEWTRSPRVAGTVGKGRYFLGTKLDALSADQRTTLTRAMSSLMNWLRERSPAKVDYRLPIYVGPHLFRALRAGTVEPVGDLGGPLVASPRRGGRIPGA